MNNIAQNTKITTTQINTLISEIDGKLNLSGGDITGRVTFKLNSNVGGALGVNTGPCLRITGGGWSAAESGAYIQLYPKESPETTSYAGNVRIVAQDGTNSSTLDIKPTYMQYSNYLQFNNGAISQIRKSNNDSYLEITGGTNSTNSSYLVLYGGNASDDKGHFGLTAYDGNSKHQLYGSAYGTLTWGGSVIHTDATYSGVSFLKCNETLSYGWNGLQYFNKSMSVSEEPTQNVSPTADWYHIIRMNHANGNGYYVDLAACFHNDRLYTRRVASGSCATGWNEIPVLVYSWKSGTQWYRKYSDGWIEQGGQTPKTADAFISVSFPIAFTQDNPNVQLTRRFYYDNDATGCQNRTTGVSSVTKTGFKCYDNGWSGAGGSAGVWSACGF